MAIEPGTVIAKRYRVTRQLGKGGMGEVFSAENTRTGRMVALKVLRAEAKSKQSAIERFRREARAAGSINSDFVTQVLDVEDDPDHGIVLVFELLEGESLVERLKRTGPISYEELWGIVEAVWMGLADAHAAGIVHRDLKPSNVFLEQRRGGTRVKILDFGISKLPKKISTQSLTQVGQSLGTFSFMPPEQIGKAKTVDHRADIYACTTLIYQAMSGKLPYQAKNVVAMMELKNKTEPRTLAEVMKTPIDPQLEEFIAQGLSRDLEKRFQSAMQALEAWRKLRPPGASSMMDLETSGSYAHTIDDSPSSSELKTRIMHTKKVAPEAEVLPPTLRQGASPYHQAEPAAPIAPPPPASGRPAAPHAQGALASPSGAPISTDPPLGTAPAAPTPASLPVAPQPYGVSESNAPPAVAMQPLQFDDEPIVPMQSGLRTTLTLIFGALALMVVGFVTVALILHLLG